MRRALAAAIALFAIGCAGVYLALDSDGDEPAAVLEDIEIEPTRSPLDRALAGLEAAQRARRAINTENYGLAAGEVAGLESLLTDLVGELSERKE